MAAASGSELRLVSKVAGQATMCRSTIPPMIVTGPSAPASPGSICSARARFVTGPTVTTANRSSARSAASKMNWAASSRAGLSSGTRRSASRSTPAPSWPHSSFQWKPSTLLRRNGVERPATTGTCRLPETSSSDRAMAARRGA